MQRRSRKRCVALISTLDTKGVETSYLKSELEKRGLGTFVIDCGIRGDPLLVIPDVPREDVARSGGTEPACLRSMTQGDAVDSMIAGLRKVLLAAYGDGRFDGVLCVGGLQGTTLGTGGMKVLPVGVPKLMVTPTASGNFRFGPYVGEKDMMMLHSITDILGMNPLTKVVFDNAVNAMAGMVKGLGPPVIWENRKMVAVTMMGNTTPSIMRIKEILKDEGYDLVIFHANGTGGRSMEVLIREGVFCACLDFTTHEITDFVTGGDCACGPGRLDAACETGIPLVLVPGGTNYIVQPGPEGIDPRFRGRKFYPHNFATSLIRTSPGEMREVGRFISGKLNRAVGPVVVMIPQHGFSMHIRRGEALHDPEGDGEFVRTLEEELHDGIRLVLVEDHINGAGFAGRVAAELLRVVKTEKK